MYLKNGDEVIEASNGRLILANSGAYCDEEETQLVVVLTTKRSLYM